MQGQASADTCASSEQVFRRFAETFGLDGDGDISAYALIAYALVERDRIDWMDHVARQNGGRVAAERMADWFRDKPDSYFTEKEKLAIGWFLGFARAALADEIERAKQIAVAESLGDLGRFWPGFWVGNLIGITSNLAFAALVVLFVLVINTDFSFVAWSRKLFGFH